MSMLSLVLVEPAQRRRQDGVGGFILAPAVERVKRIRDLLRSDPVAAVQLQLSEQRQYLTILWRPCAGLLEHPLGLVGFAVPQQELRQPQAGLRRRPLDADGLRILLFREFNLARALISFAKHFEAARPNSALR